MDVGVVFHLAAQSNVLGAVHDIDYSFSTNVLGTVNVLRAARDAGAQEGGLHLIARGLWRP